jgi:DNA invertase Pin-like site-specific DNA recombinase
MISAVGYIRMSSDKQEASPEQQRQEIISLAKRDGYRIIRWYVDEGVTATRQKNVSIFSG